MGMAASLRGVFGTNVWRGQRPQLQTIGMTETGRGDDGTVFLSVRYNDHDLVLRPKRRRFCIWAFS